jgi:isoleucyl-tRNA synthetase
MKDTPKKNTFAQIEEEILDFWDEEKAFEKSVEMRPEEKQYVFYDGPPFATGLPHYGHMLGSIAKDAVPRHWTMRGYRVERRWGWDCHGLPIENIIEKDFDLNSRADIEEYGIDKFNAACRARIGEYDQEWQKFVRRIGRWVDMENSYKTMDNSYMESVWWGFAELAKKDLVYEGRRVSLYCPRCATPLSNFEIAMDNSYKDVEDNSITVKFAVRGQENTFFLAWTTTPWTLPGNVALVVDEEAKYVRVSSDGESYYCAGELVESLFEGREHSVEETVTGADLVGLEYEPLYTYMPLEGKKAYYVIAGDFVELEEGTGIVHTAAVYGEDDFRVAQEKDLPIVPTLDEQGHFFDFVEPFAGKFFKGAEKGIIADLEERGLMFTAERYTHSYPMCWRCETPLYYYAGPAWYVDVQKIKPKMIELNDEISWRPEHLKEGRFGKGLETAPDWNVSRSRFWGTAMPVWQCSEENCDQQKIVGGVAELEELSGRDLKELDLHRPSIDEVKWDCSCGGTMTRIPDVFDCWVESGSMPFAQKHYPFENKEQFETFYPADYISEYVNQTRGWFYTLHVLSTALFEKPSFRNVVTSGVVLAEDGEKMSKSKKNFPDPTELFDTYGVDAVRFYLMSAAVMDGDNFRFSENEVSEIYKKYINTLWNVFTFYKMFAEKESGDIEPLKPGETVPHVLDQWILSQVQHTTQTITDAYDNYDIRRTALPLQDLVQEVSTWYLRRSRDRLKGDDAADAHMALRTLHTVLLTLVKLGAPVTPFITEKMYQELRRKSDPVSVHHCDWPLFDSASVREEVDTTMVTLREMIEKALSLRAEAGIKIRQPLASVTVEGKELSEEYQALLRDELNVKAVIFDDHFSLDTELTDQLRQEGLLREMIRKTNAQRKKAGLTINDHVDLKVQTEDPAIADMLSALGDEYASSVLGKSLEVVDEPQENAMKVEGQVVTIAFE